MTRFVFGKDKDTEIRYQHEDGRIENLSVGRIVEAYAQVMGIEFCDKPELLYGIKRSLDTTIDFGVIEEKGTHYLSVHGIQMELPDITKLWGPEDSKRIWNGLEYLMRM